MIEIVKLSPDDWNDISEETLKYSFNEVGWDKELNRVSYTIMAQDDKTKVPYGFATIIELDGESAHIQHGGTFPSTYGTAIGGRGFLKIIEFLRHRYACVEMNVKNTNISMLKLCLKAGFIVKGVTLDRFGHLYVAQELIETYG